MPGAWCLVKKTEGALWCSRCSLLCETSASSCKFWRGSLVSEERAPVEEVGGSFLRM